jgi:hypothetical protein
MGSLMSKMNALLNYVQILTEIKKSKEVAEILSNMKEEMETKISIEY